MRGIASRLGISATAIYQHFDGKAAILGELRMLGFDRMWASTEPMLVSGDPLDRIRAINLAYVTFCRENPWLYGVMMRSDPQGWEKMSDDESSRAQRPLRACIAALSAAKENGKTRSDLDPRLAALQIWSATHGLCSLLLHGGILDNNPFLPVSDVDVYIVDYIERVLSGVICGGARPHNCAHLEN